MGSSLQRSDSRDPVSKLDRLYQNSPVWLQNSLVSAYGLYWHWARFGGNYTHYEEGFRNREANNLAEWHKYCEGQLIDLAELEASERRLRFSQIFETNPANGEPPRIEVRPPDQDSEFDY